MWDSTEHNSDTQAGGMGSGLTFTLRLNGDGNRGALLGRAVHHILQLLAGFEERNLLGRNLDPVAGLGIATDTGLALARPETAKATNLDLVSRPQGPHYTVEDGLNNHLAVLARKFRKARDFFD